MSVLNMRFISKIVAITALIPWLGSCANHDLGPVSLIDCDGYKTVSYLDDIKPIVDDVCSVCHDGSDPNIPNWTIAINLKNNAAEASRRVQLPVTDPDHMPYDPPELTEEEIKLIVCWAEQGAPIDK